MKPDTDERPNITARERAVMDLLVDGYTTRMIAEKMWLSQYTIKAHIGNVRKKLDVLGLDRTQLIAAYRHHRNGNVRHAAEAGKLAPERGSLHIPGVR